MRDQTTVMLYNARPIGATLAGWLLVGIGGLVFLPLGAASRAWWLVILALPPLLAGLVLMQTRLRISLEPRSGLVHAGYSLFGLKLRQSVHTRSDLVGLDLLRLAGDRRERPSDTWYLKLRFHTRSYTVGKYSDRLRALEAQHALNETLRSRPPAETAPELVAAAEEQVRDQPESAEAQYRMGLASLRSGDAAGARRAFERARELTREPLLSRMIEQRLQELDRH